MSTVEEIMSVELVGIAPEDSLAKARNLMLRHRIGRLVVVEGGKPVGIVTRKDMVSRLVQTGPEWRRRPIDHIPVRLTMTTDPITIHPTASIQQAAILMRDNNISGLLVTGDSLVGIVTKTDMVRYYSHTENKSTVGELMRPIHSTVHIFHSLNHVVETMDENGVDCIMVTDGEKPVGMVAREDIAFKNILLQGKLLVAEDIMYSPITTTTPDAGATGAAAVLVEQEFDEMPVLDGGELQGMLTMTVIVNHMAEGGA